MNPRLVSSQAELDECLRKKESAQKIADDRKETDAKADETKNASDDARKGDDDEDVETLYRKIRFRCAAVPKSFEEK